MNVLLLRNEGRLGCRAVESGVSCVRWTSACPAAAARVGAGGGYVVDGGDGSEAALTRSKFTDYTVDFDMRM